MGANQSSKPQIGGINIGQQRTNITSFVQHQQAHPSKKLSSSLRKSVGNVLASSKLSSSSEKSTPSSNKCNSNSDKKNKNKRETISDLEASRVDSLDGCNLGNASLVLSQCQRDQQSTPDSYYVSPIEYRNGFTAAQNGGANNYASQSQLMLSASVMDQNKQQRQQQKQLSSANIYGKNAPNANYSYHMEPMEMNSVAKRDGLFAAQDHHNSNTISRSQQQHSRLNNNNNNNHQHHHHHHPATTTTTAPTGPFHLSRAVNTKTSSVLNNNGKNIGSSVAMPNASAGAFMASSQISTLAATNSNNHNAKNGLVSSFSANSPSAYQIQQHHRSPLNHQYAQHYLYSASGSEHGLASEQQQQQCCEDSENQQQYYLNSLLDAPKSQPTPGRRRYKCPKQQYQYLNTSSSPKDSKPLDFHQYYTKQQQQQQQQPASYRHQEHQQHQQLTLDCRNYNRSYSFGSARTLESSGKKSKAHNKLMSIFQSNSNNKQQQYSNTIHLGDKQRRSQLKQLTASGFSTATNPADQRSCPGSLKRIKPAPLSAQQASYEAMRTIDMYLIRQIARSCMVS